MKKIIALVICIVGLSSVNAQNREKGTIELIPQIGYTSANYYGPDVNNNDPISSVSFGVSGDYFLMIAGVFVQDCCIKLWEHSFLGTKKN